MTQQNSSDSRQCNNQHVTVFEKMEGIAETCQKKGANAPINIRFSINQSNGSNGLQLAIKEGDKQRFKSCLFDSLSEMDSSNQLHHSSRLFPKMLGLGMAPEAPANVAFACISDCITVLSVGIDLRDL